MTKELKKSGKTKKTNFIKISKDTKTETKLHLEKGSYGQIQKRHGETGQYSNVKKLIHEKLKTATKGEKFQRSSVRELTFFNKEIRLLNERNPTININGHIFKPINLTPMTANFNGTFDIKKKEIFADMRVLSQARVKWLSGEIPLEQFAPLARALGLTSATLEDFGSVAYFADLASASAEGIAKFAINKKGITANVAAELGCMGLNGGATYKPKYSVSLLGFNFELKEASVNLGVGAKGKIGGGADFDPSKYRIQFYMNVGAYCGFGAETKVKGKMQVDTNLHHRVTQRADTILSTSAVYDKEDLLALQRLLAQASSRVVDHSHWFSGVWGEYWKWIEISSYQEAIDDIHYYTGYAATAYEAFKPNVEEIIDNPVDVPQKVASTKPSFSATSAVINAIREGAQYQAENYTIPLASSSLPMHDQRPIDSTTNSHPSKPMVMFTSTIGSSAGNNFRPTAELIFETPTNTSTNPSVSGMANSTATASKPFAPSLPENTVSSKATSFDPQDTLPVDSAPKESTQPESKPVTTFNAGLGQNMFGHPGVQMEMNTQINNGQSEVNASINTNGQETCFTVGGSHSDVSPKINDVSGNATVFYTATGGIGAAATGAMVFSDATAVSAGASTTGAGFASITIPISSTGVVIAGVALIGAAAIAGTIYGSIRHIHKKREAHQLPCLDYSLQENKDLALAFYNLSKRTLYWPGELDKLKANIDKSRHSATTPEQHQVLNLLSFVVEERMRPDIIATLSASYSNSKYHALDNEKFLELFEPYVEALNENLESIKTAYEAGDIPKAYSLSLQLSNKFPYEDFVVTLKNSLAQEIASQLNPSVTPLDKTSHPLNVDDPTIIIDSKTNMVPDDKSYVPEESNGQSIFNNFEHRKAAIFREMGEIHQSSNNDTASHQDRLNALTAELSQINKAQFQLVYSAYQATSNDPELFCECLRLGALAGNIKDISDMLNNMQNILPGLQEIPTDKQQECVGLLKDISYSLGQMGDSSSRVDAVAQLKQIQAFESKNKSAFNQHEQAITHQYMGGLQERDSFFDHRGAEASYKESTTLNPLDPITASGYVDTLCNQGQFSEAEKVITECAKQNNHPDRFRAQKESIQKNYASPEERREQHKLFRKEQAKINKGLEDKKKEIQRRRTDTEMFYGRLGLRLGVRGATYLAKQISKYYGQDVNSTLPDEIEIENFSRKSEFVLTSLFQLYYSKSYLSTASTIANMALGAKRFTAKQMDDFVRKYPGIDKAIEWAPCAAESALGLSAFYEAYQAWVANAPSEMSPLDTVMNRASLATVIPGIAHRHFFEPMREQGNAPTGFFGIVGEDVAWIGGNRTTSTVLYLYSSREAIQSGAGYVGKFIINNCPQFLAELIQDSQWVTVGVSPADVYNAANAAVVYGSETASAAVAGAQTWFFALSVAGQVLLVGGAVVVVSVVAYQYYWHRWYGNELHNSKTKLGLVASDYKNADEHFKNAKKSAEELIKYYPEDAAAKQALEKVNLVQSILQEAKLLVGQKNTSSLLASLDKLDDDTRSIAEKTIHAMYAQEAENIRLRITTAQEDKKIDAKEKTTACLAAIGELSNIYHQQYQLLDKQSQKADDSNRRAFTKNKIILAKEILKFELDLALQNKGDFTQVTRYLGELKQYSPGDPELNSFSSRASIIEEIRKPIHDPSIFMTHLLQLDDGERLRYGHAISNSFMDRQRIIIEKINAIENNEEKDAQQKAQECKPLSNELSALGKKYYPIFVQESDHALFDDYLFVTRLRLSASQKENQEAITLIAIQKRLDASSTNKLSSDLVDEMKDTVHKFGQKDDCPDRKKIAERIVAISQHDQSNIQKSQTKFFLGNLSKLDVYFYRKKVSQYYNEALTLNSRHVEAVKARADEHCYQGAYGKAINVLDATIAIKQNDIEAAKTDKEKEDIANDIKKLEKYKKEVVDREINAVVFYGNIGLKIITWLTHKISELNHIDESQRQLVKSIEKRLGISGALANFYAQIVQHLRLANDTPKASVEVSQAQIVYAMANLGLQAMGPWQDHNPSTRMEQTALYVEALQMSTSTASTYRGLYEIFSTASEDLPLHKNYGKIGIESARLLSTPAAFIKKHWFDKYRQEGNAPTSVAMIFAEDITRLLSHDFITHMLSIYSNAPVLFDGIGWTLNWWSPLISEKLDDVIKLLVANSTTLTESALTQWNSFEKASQIVIVATGSLIAGAAFLKYWSYRWRHNLLGNAQTKLMLSFYDAKNRIYHLELAIQNINTLLDHYPKDTMARKLRDTILVVQQAYNLQVTFERKLQDLELRFTSDIDNTVIIGLTIIQTISEKVSAPNIFHQEKDHLASKGIEAIERLESYQEKLSTSLQDYLKQKKFEFLPHPEQQSKQEVNNKSTETPLSAVCVENDSAVFKTIIGVVAGVAVITQPAGAALFFVSMRLFLDYADYRRSSESKSINTAELMSKHGVLPAPNANMPKSTENMNQHLEHRS